MSIAPKQHFLSICTTFGGVGKDLGEDHRWSLSDTKTQITALRTLTAIALVNMGTALLFKGISLVYKRSLAGLPLLIMQVALYLLINDARLMGDKARANLDTQSPSDSEPVPVSSGPDSTPLAAVSTTPWTDTSRETHIVKVVIPFCTKSVQAAKDRWQKFFPSNKEGSS